MIEFQPFPKIGRLSRDVIVTEKLDGTNAQIIIEEATAQSVWPVSAEHEGKTYHLGAASRTQLIAPAAVGGKSADNFGFAGWVQANASELVKLGPGRHFGEWWGQGIQRNYGLTEKRFSLFNVRRWNADNPPPTCCHVVPELWRGNFDTPAVLAILSALGEHGSTAAPGFMKPEGIVIFHTQSGALFKKTFEKDDAGKGKEPEREMAA